MKNYTMFNYNFLFSDHFAKVSNQARLYYVALNFYALNGFVANPLQILDSFGYDKSVFQELVSIDEILTIPDRDEIFITSYFVHNKGLKCYSWRATPYAIYWENRLFVKKNGVATFTPQGRENEKPDDATLDKIVEPDENDQPNPDDEDWDTVMSQLCS